MLQLTDVFKCVSDIPNKGNCAPPLKWPILCRVGH